MTLHVVVDGRPLSAAFSSSGSAAYLRGLLPAMARRGVDVGALVSNDSEAPQGVTPVHVRRHAPEQLGYFEQLVRLSKDIADSTPDVFHSPATDPPRHSPVPWVQTLLDLIPLVIDAPVFRLERRLWRARARRIRKAAAVIAISAHTAREGIERIGLDPTRVEVVHLGVDPAFRPPAVRDPGGPPFVLLVSNLAPHKGYREAFAVLGELAEHGLPHRLKLVGGWWPSEGPRVRAALAASGQADRVDVLGRVSAAELVSLYQRASAVVVTSRYEGFGLPAAEAMASGTPVVAFDNSSLPEVIGDGGVLVPDGDVAAFAAAVRSVLTNEHRWDELSRAGLARATAFDWDRCAVEHLEIMQRCAA